MNPTITLYTNPWSRSAIVHWMLEEVGVPYQTVVLDYGTTMKSAEYLALNPMGKVPTLKDGNEVITECPAICAYLADKYPEAGLAPALDQRADYYRWLFFAAGPLEQAVSLASLGFQPSAEEQQRLGCGQLSTVLDTLAEAVRDREFIAGSTFTAADVYVGSHIGWGLQFGTIDDRPEFVDYWQRLSKRPAHKRSEEVVNNLSTQKAWE